MRTIFYLMQKEFRQVLRDRAMLGVIFLMPMVQLFVLGFAINNDVINLAVAVVDDAGTAQSRHLAERFRASGRFSPVFHVERRETARELMDRQRINLILVIPRNFSTELESGRIPPVQVIVDGVESNTALVASGYAQGIIARHIREAIDGGRPDVIASSALYNPELESSYGYVPGILAVLLTIITALLTALGLVKEKEIGTLEQLNVTPITSFQLLLGKVLPFAVLGGVSFAVSAVVAFFVYGLIMNGSVVTLGVLTLIYMLATLNTGVLASTLAGTQQQAVFAAWFMLVANILMSGFMFPIDNMPVALQKATLIIPLRHYVTGIRAIILKGAGLADLQVEMMFLGAIGICLFFASVLAFRKTV